MFQRDPITFNRLKALSMRKRMDVVRSPDVGPGLFTTLTPSDLASLFPDYYKRILPDVGGFRRAISAQSAKESAVAAGKLEERLAAVESKSASIMTPWAQRQKQASAPAQLSPEQMAAFQKIQQGAIGLNSPDAKFFSILSTSQLASIGITKGKDNTGADVYQYSAPEVTREEAVGRLKTGAAGGDSIRKNVYNSFLSAGFSPQQSKALTAEVGRENNFNPNLIYGTHAEPGGGAGVRGRENIGIFSWGDPKRHAQFVEYMRSNGGYDENGKLKRDQNTLILQAKFVKQEMAAYNDSSRAFLANKEVSRDQGGQYLASYIGWDIAGHHINAQEHIDRRNRYYAQIEAISGGERPSGPGGQYSEEQITKMMEQLRTEKNEQRRSELATLIGSAGGQAAQDSTAAVTGKVTYGQVKDFSQYVLYDHSKSQCGVGTRTLAGHMYGHGSFLNEGIGKEGAGSLSRGNNYFQKSGLFQQPRHVSDDAVKNQAYLDSLPIGTVVSQTGGKSVGHVQIKIGPGQWASDFRQQHFLSNGYSDFTVHMPNEAGLDALKRNGVDQSVTAIAGDENKVQISPTPIQRAGEPPEAPAVAPPATPPSYNPEAGDSPDLGGPAPTATVQKAGSDFQQQSEQLNPQAVKDIQAAPPPSPNKFKVDSAGFVAAIRATQEFKSQAGFFADAIPDSTILNGFNDDQRVRDAGVKYDPNTGVMTFKDPNDPRVKEVMRDFDTKKFMTPIEEKKKEAAKPKQQAEAPKEIPSAPTPTADVSKPEPPKARAGEPPEAPPAPPPEPAPKQVQGYSEGGSFDMKGDTLSLYKVDKQDDMVAINPQTQEPIATLKSGEGITSGDSRVDVTPQSKTTDARPEPSPLNTMAQKVNNLENTMQSAIELANRPTTKIESMTPDTQTNHSNLIADTNRMIANQQKFSPSYDRAMNRIANMSEPPGYNQHYSYGNK